MADLILRRQHPGKTPTGIERLHYRAVHLGRSHGDSLLTELLPYPHPKLSDWLYARFGKFKTREEYTEKTLPERRKLLRSVIGTAHRELIVCYGKGNWTDFQDLFDDVNWSDVGPFRGGGQGATRIVLSTHFSGYGFNADARLAELADIALQGVP